MSAKARRYLTWLAVLLVAGFVLGVQFYKVYQENQKTGAVYATYSAQLDQLNKGNAAKQQETDDSKTDTWVIQQAHQLGMVQKDEIKIVVGDK